MWILKRSPNHVWRCQKVYGKGLVATWGKVHTYLGIDFDYSTNKDGAQMTVTWHLDDHKVSHVDPLEEQAQLFHHSTAHLLFFAMRARLNLFTLVSFFPRIFLIWRNQPQLLIYAHAHMQHRFVWFFFRMLDLNQPWLIMLQFPCLLCFFIAMIEMWDRAVKMDGMSQGRINP